MVEGGSETAGRFAGEAFDFRFDALLEAGFDTGVGAGGAKCTGGTYGVIGVCGSVVMIAVCGLAAGMEVNAGFVVGATDAFLYPTATG